MKKRSHHSSVGRLLVKLQELDPNPVDSRSANGLRQRQTVAVARSTWIVLVPYARAWMGLEQGVLMGVISVTCLICSGDPARQSLSGA
jgi:hypothetical protein